jgi:conjugative relaxase-like TrwC/TraI family protein
VLNIGKLAAGRESYYLAQVAEGAEDYYLASGEAPGEWQGNGAVALGLSGRVEAEHLRAVLSGGSPDGVPLVRPGKRTPGFDLTFRAPKSVSLLHALGQPDVAREVLAAHDQAVADAVRYLERHACQTRRGAGGRLQLQGEGFVAAAFRHRTSRAGDPTLHTHVLIANLVHADGRWGTLDGRLLYAESKTAAYLYQAVLRQELTQRLGVGWQPVRHGMADVEGFDRPMIEEFSTRRREILDELERRGASSPQAAQVATLTTRAPKRDTPRAALVADWRERAHRVGLTPDVLQRACGRTRSEASVTTTAPELLGPKGLTGRRSTFTRRDVVQAWCGALAHGGTVAQIERLTADAIASDEVLELADSALLAQLQRGLRRNDGGRIPSVVEPRYTTREMAAAEASLVDGALARRDARVGVVEPALVEAAMGLHPHLDDDQRRLVRSVTGSGAGLEVIVGKAGSGKTTALAAARAAWQASGHTVLGGALAARAAAELARGAGIPAVSIHRLGGEIAQYGLPPGSVLVIDEAAMIGTRPLAYFAGLAERYAAKLVLVGDDRQLPAIDAGGGFRALTQAAPTNHLSVNRRQVEPWERDALDHLAEGKVGTALTAYADHDRIRVCVDAESARAQLVADWLDARLAGRHGPMLAHHRGDVDDLNERARAALRGAGLLQGNDVHMGGRSFAVGDEVVGLRNDYAAQFLNGSLGTIVAIDRWGDITVSTRDGGPVTVPHSYVRTGNLDHSYALTVHKAQGGTYDTSFVLADDHLYREAAYVALSRGRADSRIYTVADDGTDEHRTHERPDPLRRLRTSAARSHAEPSIRELDRSVSRSVSRGVDIL